MGEYAIEEADDPERLAELVTSRLHDGWRLQGGVSVVCYVTEDRDESRVNHWWYAQALMRDADA